MRNSAGSFDAKVVILAVVLSMIHLSCANSSELLPLEQKGVLLASIGKGYRSFRIDRGELSELRGNSNPFFNLSTADLSVAESTGIFFVTAHQFASPEWYAPRPHNAYIFMIRLADLPNPKPELVTQGSLPRVNQSSAKVAFLRSGHEVWMYDLRARDERKIVDNLEPTAAAYHWIDVDRIIFLSTDGLRICNSETRDSRQIGYDDLIPGALSRDGRRVLCVSPTKNTVYILDTTTETRETVFESSNRIGWTFVWSRDGSGFFYMAYPKSIIPNEEPDLYFYSLLEKRHYHVLERLGMFEGAWLD